MLDDLELTRRSLLGFGELLAALGRWSTGAELEVRRPDAIGARIEAVADNPFFNAAVVPVGVEPPKDDPQLPFCLWTVADSSPGRVEAREIATPCMGLALGDLLIEQPAVNVPAVETPPLAVLGEVNERAYGETGYFSTLVQTLRGDHRIRTYGLRDGGVFVCVALTLAVGDDLGIHYVATEESHRRRGLASLLVRAIMIAAQNEGMRSATLQASADGLPVWKHLGFKHVATMRGYVRSSSNP